MKAAFRCAVHGKHFLAHPEEDIWRNQIGSFIQRGF